MSTITPEDDLNYNPCRFKNVCMHCNKVDLADRPTGCASIECEDYIPCEVCGNNRDIAPGKQTCTQCAKKEHQKQLQEKIRGGPLKSSLDEIMAADKHATNVVTEGYKNFIVPELGEPPHGLSDSEKQYFKDRWEQFDGYYRDPSAYSIVHAMILEELNLRRLEQQIIQAAGSLIEDKTKEKGTCLKYLHMLKKQLPDKEALKGNDAETALSMIYDKYKKEQGALAVNSRGRVTRLFSLEAIALAPQLPHRLNLVKMLQRCGYEIQAIEDAVVKYHTELGNTPEEILEGMGFKLKEKYARPYETYEREDEIDASAFSETDAYGNRTAGDTNTADVTDVDVNHVANGESPEAGN